MLSYGIMKIRSFLQETGMKNQINSKAMCLHGACFGAFMLAQFALIFECLFLAGNQNSHNDDARTAMTVWIINLFLQFIVQVTLIFIFRGLGQKSTEQGSPRTLAANEKSE